MNKSFGRCLRVVGLVGVLTACGARVADEGTESHWLVACESDAQCGSGSCLCGVCTTTCESVYDCPHPLDSCGEEGLSPSGKTCKEAKGQRLCTVHDEATLQNVSALKTTVVEACDERRPTRLGYASGVLGNRRAAAAGDGTFFLFYPGTQTQDVVRVDTDGHVLQQLAVPSDRVGSITDLIVLPSGTVVVAGDAPDTSGPKAWVGALDVNWNLVWEQTLGGAGGAQVDLALLPSGDFFAAAVAQWPDVLDLPEEQRQDVLLALLGEEGDVRWEKSLRFSGYDGFSWGERRLTLSGEEARVVVPTEDGIRVVVGRPDGTTDDMALDTTLAGGVSGVTALPTGRFAVASYGKAQGGAVIAVIEADGSVAWEQVYEKAGSAAPSAIAYDSKRKQIVLAGDYRADGDEARTWMIATDLEGEQQWQLVRDPQRSGSEDAHIDGVAAGEGPTVAGLAIDPDGNIVAPAQSTFELSFFVIRGGVCEE